MTNEIGGVVGEVTIPELARVLERLGCPAGQCEGLARQLDRRARMDAERKQVAYDSALGHLVGLMAQGWVATRDGELH